MNRRRHWIRRGVPWLLAFTLIGVTGYKLVQAVSERDLVERASQLRTGNDEAGEPPDPVSAIEVLDKLLARKPRHSEALMEMSRAWVDLGAWNNAIEVLETAMESTSNVKTKVRATDMAMNILAIAKHFDEAFAMGDRLVALEPEKISHALKLGNIYNRGSADSQAQATKRFLAGGTKTMKDLRIEQQIEAYVTEIWREPDLDSLLDELLPEADAVLRQDIAEKLLTARTRFLKAYEILSGYRNFGGWNASVARAYTKALYRVGRLYDAHIEAGMALREPNLSLPHTRDFLEVQALCSVAIEDFGTAADSYERILDLYEQHTEWPPSVFVWWMYECRMKAGQFLWILNHIEDHKQQYGNDVFLRYVHSMALAMAGKTDEARLELSEPFNAVALGGKSFMPPSLRRFPERRREVGMTSFHLFNAIGDKRASQALDAVLALNPEDVEALRLRSGLNLRKGDADGAAQDAFDLLTLHRRDRGDFDLWVDASDALSVQRYGLSLEERAVAKVSQSERWYLRRGNADYAIRETLKNKRVAIPRFESLPDQLFVPGDPALTFAIVLELTQRNDVTRARQELRKLSVAFPQVQEFRYRLGRLLVRGGNFESAAEEFRRLLEDIPSDTEALDLATRTDRALGRHQQAADLINRMILEKPLEVGAVRHGQHLLEIGQADKASRLVDRLVVWTDLNLSTDILVLAGRAKLELGQLNSVSAILNTLSQHTTNSVEVALLGLDLGLVSDKRSLVDAAVNNLQRLAPELFPDQMEAIANRLLKADLLPQLRRVFPPQVTRLPAAQPALRAVARAEKALGDPTEAESLLALRENDELAMLDGFLLAAMQRRTAEAAKELRLTPGLVEQAEQLELILMVANALQGIAALRDQEPEDKLIELGLDRTLDPAALQMLDALLRIMPSFDRLDDVVPAGALSSATATWPLAGKDIERLLLLSVEAPDTARLVAENLLFLVLMGGRDFWERETQSLAEHSLLLLPDLVLPTRALARQAVASGRSLDALRLLQPLIDPEAGAPHLVDLDLFMQASRLQEHGEWGVVYAMRMLNEPGVRQLLADKLTEWGHDAQAKTLYLEILLAEPKNREALGGLLRTMISLRQDDEIVDVVDAALAAHPDDEQLRFVCADALALHRSPPPRAIELMEQLWLFFDDLPQIGEALARANQSDPERVDEILGTMIARIAARSEAGAPGERRNESQTLVRSSTAARRWGLTQRARELNELALRITPGSVRLFNELAYLELKEGNLDTARRYLQVLCVTNVTDRATAMALSKLDFQQLGRPRRAADTVRRTFHGTLPPKAVEILAAEAYLLGNPQDAIKQFHAISRSPLLSADTYLTVARIAYSAGEDAIARLLFEQVLLETDEDDPRRPRCLWLCEERLPTRKQSGARKPPQDVGQAKRVVLPSEAAVSVTSQQVATSRAADRPMAEEASSGDL